MNISAAFLGDSGKCIEIKMERLEIFSSYLRIRLWGGAMEQASYRVVIEHQRPHWSMPLIVCEAGCLLLSVRAMLDLVHRLFDERSKAERCVEQSKKIQRSRRECKSTRARSFPRSLHRRTIRNGPCVAVSLRRRKTHIQTSARQQ